jgi:hypothetical protein
VIVRGKINEHADAPHPLARLLRAGRAWRQRPRCCASDQADELAPPHDRPSLQ